MGLCSKDRGAAAVAAPQPPVNKDPYETIRIPMLPDLSRAPPELQVFRDQCAAGVRQAVAMITAMEHQLWWERSRRQQAEDDVGVLLGAVAAERNLAGSAVSELAGAVKEAQAARKAAGVQIAAAELPQASAAATTIQKTFRGHAARKEYETQLRDILRGVDPELDPAALPASAQHHISAVNVKGAASAVRTLMDPQAAAMLVGDPHTEGLRGEVAVIEKRMAALAQQDSKGGDPEGALLAGSLDVKAILSGSLPASSAAVIASLVRRCKELQAGLVAAAEELSQARLALTGLRAENSKVVDLSALHTELQAEREAKNRLSATLSRLRNALTVQAQAQNGATAQHNPYISSWYRQQYAATEFQQYQPPAPGSKAQPRAVVFDGPEAEVEFWDDLRPGQPEPILIPREAPMPQQYKDLLALRADMAATAGQGPWDSLYASPVPDTSQFKYARDTPIVPMASPSLLMRENLPPPTYMDYHAQLPPGMRSLSPAPPGSLAPGPDMYQMPATGPAGPGSAPWAPMYSVLPLLREDALMAGLPSTDPAFYSPAQRRALSSPGGVPAAPGTAAAAAPYATYTAYANPPAAPGTPPPQFTVHSPLGLIREQPGAPGVQRSAGSLSAGGGNSLRDQYENLMASRAAGAQGAAPPPPFIPGLNVQSPLPLIRESGGGAMPAGQYGYGAMPPPPMMQQQQQQQYPGMPMGQQMYPMQQQQQQMPPQQGQQQYGMQQQQVQQQAPPLQQQVPPGMVPLVPTGPQQPQYNAVAAPQQQYGVPQQQYNVPQQQAQQYGQQQLPPQQYGAPQQQGMMIPPQQQPGTPVPHMQPQQQQQYAPATPPPVHPYLRPQVF